MTCDALLVFGASCFRSFFHDFHDVLLVLFWVMAPLSRFVIWIRFSTLDVESTQKWKRISWLPGWTGVKTQIDYVAITSLWLYMCCISFVFTCGLMRIPCKQKKYCTTRHYENPVMNVQQDFMKCNDRVLNTYDSETWHPGVTFFGSLEGGVSNLWAVPHIPGYLWILLLVPWLLMAEILHYL